MLTVHCVNRAYMLTQGQSIIFNRLSLRSRSRSDIPTFSIDVGYRV